VPENKHGTEQQQQQQHTLTVPTYSRQFLDISVAPDQVKEFPTFWYPKVHHRTHNSPSPLATLNRLNAFNNFVFIFYLAVV
jgi:hypothetical protein